MTKTFCDCCLKETNSINHFSYLCHLENNMRINGYVDSDGNAVSGRTIDKVLCNKCYNDIVSKAVNRLKELQLTYSKKSAI